MSTRGDAKPIPFVEDPAVDPSVMGEFVRRFDEIVTEHGTTAGYYGHASVGCLHIRPLVSLKNQDGIDKMVSIGEAVSDLIKEFGGSMSGEHGDGIVRGVWTRKMFGDQIYNAFRELKQTWDPQGIMNPGKIIDTPPMTENLRYGVAYQPRALDTTLDFSADFGYRRRGGDVQRHGRLPQDGRHHVPVLHGHPRRGALYPRTRQPAPRRPLGTNARGSRQLRHRPPAAPGP